MSGIAGFFNRDGAPADHALLKRMAVSMSSRGPDACDTWLHGALGLAHTLLRTNPEPEQQPCTLDGEVWITADARIDARDDLRQELRTKSCSLPPNRPDVELILYAYRVWGSECVHHLLGDFAFVIWDGNSRSLFCARDHFGVKPFYYSLKPRLFVFSNTQRCVRMYPALSSRLDELAIADFLVFGDNQNQASSCFADIRRLRPAHYLTVSATDAQIHRYWELPGHLDVRHHRSAAYLEQFQELLRAAVKDRLRTKQVAVYFSGGLDSTAVAAETRRQGANIRAFTSVYRRLIPDPEPEYAQAAADFLEIPLEFQEVDQYQLFERWSDPAVCPPQPWVVPFAAIGADGAEQASGYSRVCLTGEGGDAVLMPSVRQVVRDMLSARLPKTAAEICRYVGVRRRLPRIGLKAHIQQLVPRRFWRTEFPKWLAPGFMERMHLEQRWADLHARDAGFGSKPETCAGLLRVSWALFFEVFDASSSEFGIELRHPWLDLRLVQFVLGIPTVPWCVDKELVRRAGHGILPESILERPKTRLMGCPTSEWLGRECSQWIDDFVPVAELEEYVVRAKVPKLVSTGAPGAWWRDLRPLVLNIWMSIQQRGDGGFDVGPFYRTSTETSKEVC